MGNIQNKCWVGWVVVFLGEECLFVFLVVCVVVLFGFFHVFLLGRGRFAFLVALFV